MDLKDVCRNILNTELFIHKHQKASWRILIIDGYTANILTNLYSKSELLSNEIAMISRIEEDREKSENPGLYFVKPDDSIIKKIEKDHKTKKYSRFTIVLTNELTKKQEDRLKKLENPSCVLRNTNINFFCFDSFVFLCDYKNILQFAKVVDNNYNVFYVDERDKDIAFELEVEFNERGARKGDLLFFDRLYDQITPLMRFYTFQSLLNDFGFVTKDLYEKKNVSLESFDLWNKLRFKHIREVNSVISNESKNLAKEMNKPDDMSMSEFMKMVLSAPKAIQTKEEITVFLELLNLCLTKFEQEDLNFVSLCEQNIALKRDAQNNTYDNGLEDLFKFCNDGKVGYDDMKRIYLMLGICGYDIDKKNENELKSLGAIQSADIKTNEKLKKIRNLNIRVKQNQCIYTVSRFTPVIETLIKDFIDFNKPQFTFYDFTGGEKHETYSLRKTTFIYTKTHKKRRAVCLYVKNGITYEEIKCVHDMSKKYNIDIFLGSDKILSYGSFIQTIDQMIK